MADPRTSVNYARMTDVINHIEGHGPMKMAQIIRFLKIRDSAQWKAMRYGLPGRLALEDAGYSMPRPVASEGYVYKLVTSYRTGIVDDDGEPNLTKALSDLLTRQATVYRDLDEMLNRTPAGTKLRKLMKNTRYAMGGVLGGLETVVTAATPAGATPLITPWAEHVIDSLP